MIFEFGKKYIVNVTEKGLVPLIEFNRSQWVNKDYDDLDFLTDEEKEVIVNDVLKQIRAKIEQEADYQDAYVNADIAKGMYLALEIFDKYKEGDNK